MSTTWIVCGVVAAWLLGVVLGFVFAREALEIRRDLVALNKRLEDEERVAGVIDLSEEEE